MINRFQTSVGPLVGFENVPNNIEKADQLGNCHSQALREAREEVELEDAVPQTNISHWPYKKLRVSHQNMKYMPHGLFLCQDEGLLDFISDRVRLIMLLFGAYFCCDITESKYRL